jgi:hypothetical protein
MGLGLLCGLGTVNFSRVGSLVARPTLNLEDQELHFIWLLPFDLSGMVSLPGAYAPASIALQVIEVRSPPLHNEAVVLKEEFYDYSVLFWKIQRTASAVPSCSLFFVVKYVYCSIDTFLSLCERAVQTEGSRKKKKQVTLFC